MRRPRTARPPREPRAPASRRFAAVGLWTNKALDGDDKIKDYDDFENGPGFATAAVCGALAVLSLLISIGALVLGGKEGGAPEAVDSKNKDVEMANAK